MSKGLTANYVDFVVGSFVKSTYEEIKPMKPSEVIYVYSHRLNKRIYKKPKRLVGFILKNISTQDYGFHSATNETGICVETLVVITNFLQKINNGKIIFDNDKGELELL